MTATLRPRPKTQRVLRYLMDQQQAVEIGERVRELRENSAETNRSIADYTGVGERSVAAWVAGDGISYKNAKKVAELFEVDIDWLWRGRERQGTPDLMEALSPGADSKLAEEVAQLRAEVAELTALFREVSDRGLSAQTEQLSRMSEVHSAQADVLQRLERIERGQGEAGDK